MDAPNHPQSHAPALIKVQQVESRRVRSERRLRCKTCCPAHPSEKLVYRCAEEGCRQPFMCRFSECLEGHFHSPTLRLTRIDASAFEEKFERAQQAIASSEKFFSEAFQIKAVVDSLKNSVALLFKDVSAMGKVFGDLKADLDSALTCAFIGKVDEALAIETKINVSIEKIRAKINLAPEQTIEQAAEPSQQPHQQQPQQVQTDEFFLKNEVSMFLEANLQNFSWKTAKAVINTRERVYSCSEFHKELAGRPNLVFIFAAERMVVGSYFSCPYPAGEAAASDPTSFIFTVRQDSAVKILKFLANSDSAHHIEVSERFLVSHGGLPTEEKGLRISCDELDSLEVTLPSESFVAENTAEEEIAETVRLSQILVLQVGPDDS